MNNTKASFNRKKRYGTGDSLVNPFTNQYLNQIRLQIQNDETDKEGKN